MTSLANEYLTMVEDCEQRGSRLTGWEIGFIDDMRMLLEHELALSPKQTETLERIWERATACG
jgi:hypothetical protein